jgi:hypothetical protein
MLTMRTTSKAESRVATKASAVSKRRSEKRQPTKQAERQRKGSNPNASHGHPMPKVKATPRTPTAVISGKGPSRKVFKSEALVHVEHLIAIPIQAREDAP